MNIHTSAIVVTGTNAICALADVESADASARSTVRKSNSNQVKRDQMLYCPSCKPPIPNTEPNKAQYGLVNFQGSLAKKTQDSWEGFGKCTRCGETFKISLVKMERILGEAIVEKLKAKGATA